MINRRQSSNPETNMTIDRLDNMFANSAEIWMFVKNDMLPYSQAQAEHGMWTDGRTVYCLTQEIANGLGIWLAGYGYVPTIDPPAEGNGWWTVTVM